MSIHAAPHPLAGTTVTLGGDRLAADAELKPGTAYRVEDWWDRVSGQSWATSQGNPAALKYAVRTACGDIAGKPVPDDDEVLYGKVNGIGHLVHVCEIEVPS